MYKIAQILCICAVCALASTEQLQVSAKKIESDLKKGQTLLNGDVVVTKGGDTLWADKVLIETNKKNQPTRYVASGNVRFHTKLPDKEFKGKAKKAIYDVQKDEYQLIDNAMIEEVGKQNSIKGDVITFSPSTEEALVKGSDKKPSVLTFIMEPSP
ncbi:lipopolysaccharide transport periplasmic protein LptA [Helicobacter marmotae]|nr:lipopolysaccharide transport periplasmic protein LptA [Helicobacter marmotae]